MKASGRVRLLDVGSGAGSNSLLAALLGLNAVSCDVSLASLAESRRVARALGTQENNQIVRADSCDLPFRTESFHVVIASHIIEHMDAPTAFLFEIDRVLRSGGVLRLSCPSTVHGMRVSRWLGLRLDPEDHKAEGYDSAAIAAMLPDGLRIQRCTYQGRFFESNLADMQHVLSRWLGLRANPVEGGSPPRHEVSTLLRAMWVLKEIVLLPALALCTLEDVLCFFLPGSMITIEIEKS
jgi:SAM-dependent methyltransferase